MQAKISAGNDCLRFLRVTGGNLPAPAGNSHEVFIIRVRADFFKPRAVSFYPVPNTLTKGTICFLWSHWWTFQIWFCSKSVEVFFAGSSNQYPKKSLAEKVCSSTCSLVALRVPEMCFWPAKTRKSLNFLRCIHVIDLVLKYGSDINEGN